MKLCLVIALMLVTSAVSISQSKDEMPFSSSPDAVKLLRQAWNAYSDIRLDEGNGLVKQAIEKDPSFAMAYISLYTPNADERKQNASKAASLQLSPDEKLFVDGIKARLENQPTEGFFNPLLKKYPKDYYLCFMIMLNTETKGRIEIGEAIIKRNSKFAPAYNLLGYAYMDQNDMAKAEANLDKYISLRPELGNTYDSKGDYMMRTGNFKEALTLYEKAASLGQPGSDVRAQRTSGRIKYPNISEQDKEEIKKAVSGIADAYLKSSADAFLSYFSDQGIEIFADQTVNVGAPNIRVRLTNQFKNMGSFSRYINTVDYIEGLGPIAIARGKSENTFKSFSTNETTDSKRDFTFLFHKQTDGKWKILVTSFSDAVPEVATDEVANVRKVLSVLNTSVKIGQEFSEQELEQFISAYSPQVIEVFPSQRSNIGKANVSMRLSGFIGSKWETNSLGILGVSVSGRRATAWGLWVQNSYSKGSDKLVKYTLPWVMILTKEKDNAWRVLALHWYND